MTPFDKSGDFGGGGNVDISVKFLALCVIFFQYWTHVTLSEKCFDKLQDLKIMTVGAVEQVYFMRNSMSLSGLGKSLQPRTRL